MPQALRVLLVEDSEADAALAARELGRGFDPLQWERVETSTQLKAALDRATWDLALCDHALPQLDGPEALKILKACDPELPVILLSGTIGEEAAVEALKAGAGDYILKGNLARLLPAVEQQLREAAERRTRRQAEQALRESEERFRQLADNIGVFFYLTDPQNTRIFYASPAYEAIWGRSLQSLYENPRSWFDAVHPEDREYVSARMERTASEPTERQYRIVRPDGTLRWIRSRGFPVRDQSGAVHRIAGVAEDITDRVRLQDDLREREAGLRRAQLMARLAHVITGPDGSFERWSETLPQLIGVAPAELPRTTRAWLDIVHPDDRARFRAKAIEAAARRAHAELEYRLRRADGAWIQVLQTMEPLDGEPAAHDRGRWFNTLQDVSEHKRAEERIARLNRVYAVLSGINSLIVRVCDRDELFREACRLAVDNGKFAMAWIGLVDRSAMQIRLAASKGGDREYIEAMPLALGLDEAAAESYGLAARAVTQRKAMIANDMTSDPRVLLQLEARRLGFRGLVVLPLLIAGDAVGVLALYAAEAGFFDDEEMKLLLELAGDISFAMEHIENEERLNYLAYYDSLTGLANGALFRERLAQLVQASRQSKRSLAVAVVDVDRFKTINDTLGRQAGDDLLKQIAGRMAAYATDPSQVARLGADRFAIMAPGVKSESEAARLAEERLRECFGPPFRIGDTELRISVRVGLALFPDDGPDADALFRNAESALKRAKATGERFLFYTEQMTERTAEKLALENKLRQALEKEQFVLHYQPKIDLERRTVVGVEALIRWQSPELGLVPPGRFIPLLEETGLILQVGSWALNRAAVDHRAWVEARLAAPRVAVNVSSIQLRQRDFVDIVERAIMAGVAPVGIDLEITESLIMQDVEATIEKLKKVRGLGIRVAIDDFGTGYSSLAYLAKLPVETLKIDRSFVIKMLEDPDTATLVQMMISMAHSLRLKVVAEGVDSEEQAKVLRLLRCDEMQGYLFSKPLPKEQMTALLSAKA